MTNLALQEAPPRLSPSERRLVLLAPRFDQIDDRLTEGSANPDRYEDLLTKLQRFRGSMYLQDGALRQSELEPDGRHSVDADYSGWHVVAVDNQDHVCGCSRYKIYPSGIHFSELAVGRSALAHSSIWRSDLFTAVQNERELAHKKGVKFVEVGGWAISAELRRTTGGTANCACYLCSRGFFRRLRRAYDRYSPASFRLGSQKDRGRAAPVGRHGITPVFRP